MPIVHDVEQGTPAWLALRLGKPTASEFDRIVTPGGKLAKNETSRRYAYKLATERLLNRSLDSIDNLDWVERGAALEPDAARHYAFVEEVETKTVGFITSDDGRLGCSPDRLIVGVNASVELKCPAEQTQMRYLVEGFGRDYHVQCQGQIYVGGFDYVDLYAWHPEMPSARARVFPDPIFQQLLGDALRQFTAELDEMVEKAKACGTFAPASIPINEWDRFQANLEDKGRYLDAG